MIQRNSLPAEPEIRNRQGSAYSSLFAGLRVKTVSKPTAIKWMLYSFTIQLCGLEPPAFRYLWSPPSQPASCGHASANGRTAMPGSQQSDGNHLIAENNSNLRCQSSKSFALWSTPIHPPPMPRTFHWGDRICGGCPRRVSLNSGTRSVFRVSGNHFNPYR